MAVNKLSVLGRATLDHAAFQVRTGMMAKADWFFREIGWFQLHDRYIRGPWGQTRFFTSGVGMPVVRLIEPAKGDPKELAVNENHLAIHFAEATPERVAREILLWAQDAGVGAVTQIEKVNPEGSRWLVYMPSLFTFAIEIV